MSIHKLYVTKRGENSRQITGIVTINNNDLAVFVTQVTQNGFEKGIVERFMNLYSSLIQYDTSYIYNTP